MKVILIDSGTTNSRLRLYDRKTSQILDSEKVQVGVRDTAISGNNHHLKAQLSEGIARLLTKNHLTPVDIGYMAASGMITSNLGIYEIPHVPSPAGMKDIAKYSKVIKLKEFFDIPCIFIPGMKNSVKHASPNDVFARINDFDVMRGEEVESFGLMKQFNVTGKGMMVLPGSHTKFVAVDDQKDLQYCLSTLGGETLHALQKETILSSSLEQSLVESIDKEMLELGFEAAKKYGLTRTFYHIRLFHLFANLDANQRANYFAGAVIYNDLQALFQSIEEIDEIKWFIVGGSDPLRKVFTHLLRFVSKEWEIFEADDSQVEYSVVLGAEEIISRCSELNSLID
ncbi:2-dehydro-3-deoxygalactonokinase [Paenibacillus sp. BSR1-1]|uniref:2-dehydro-3-deoxygalactonokinase n=1 Tax=Paenibacillus sp. BSR1-1 TaxID=3020845 RepID=UPI0025B1B0E7|nr:2-dehydro-3-deoxygalactonokinase [Paenibacillus sp. BSR1-1]MDN3019090.1 2-dehydro-3-deoxygalactonokinase [Paenibacillus sp. BSR1-1]